MNTNSASSLNVFKIASAYIGTVVGAGFASGQEILQFFGAFGAAGLFGVVISSVLFFFIGYSILILGRHLKATSHVDIVRYTNGPFFGSFIDIIITIFMFGGLAAMIAGAGAIFDEQFSISPIWCHQRHQLCCPFPHTVRTRDQHWQLDKQPHYS